MSCDIVCDVYFSSIMIIEHILFVYYFVIELLKRYQTERNFLARHSLLRKHTETYSLINCPTMKFRVIGYIVIGGELITCTCSRQTSKQICGKLDMCVPMSLTFYFLVEFNLPQQHLPNILRALIFGTLQSWPKHSK